MSDGLKWVMELFDRTSAPARRVASALDGVRVAQDRVRASSARAARTPDPLAPLERATGARRAARQRALGRELAEFARTQGAAGSSTSVFAGILGGAGAVLGVVAGAAIAAATAIAGVGSTAASSAVQLAGFQESTFVAFQTLLGGRGAAEREFDSALRIARMTPFDTRAVVSLRRQLIGAGIRDERERDVMTGVIADLAALNPEDSTVMQRLGLAIGQIRGAGRLRGQELNQLVQAGLSRDELFQAIGQARGIRGDAASVNRRVAALVEGGRVNAAATFAALARATQRQTNTTRSGQYSSNQSTTILGLLSTLGSAVPELLLGRDASGTRFFESPGMQAFKSFLTQVVELLSSTSATGRRLQSIMRGLSDSVFSVFNVSPANGGLAGRFNGALDVVEKLIAAVKVAASWAGAFGQGFGSTFMPLMKALLPTIQETFGLVNGGQGSAALTFFKALGAVIGAVVWLSIALPTATYTMIGYIIDAIKWLWSQLPDWFRGFFGDGPSTSRPLPAPPPPALAGANGIVTAGPGQPSAARTIVSQPNVTVNVAATAANGLGLDQIASAVGSTIPQVVQTSAERASTGGAAQ